MQSSGGIGKMAKMPLWTVVSVELCKRSRMTFQGKKQVNNNLAATKLSC